MYRVHYVEQTDKMSEQVHLRMMEEVYAPELLQACVQRSRLSQGRVWDKLTHWLQDRFPAAPQEPAGASAVSYQRAILGVEPLKWLFEQGTHLLCTPETAGANTA